MGICDYIKENTKSVIMGVFFLISSATVSFFVAPSYKAYRTAYEAIYNDSPDIEYVYSLPVLYVFIPIIVLVLASVLFCRYVHKKSKDKTNILISVRCFKGYKYISDNIYELFSSAVDDVDVLVYQLGIRPEIPVMDLVYHLFVKELFKSKRLAKLIIIASFDNSIIVDDYDGDEAIYDLFKKRTYAIYGDYAGRVEIYCFSELAEKCGVKADMFVSREFAEACKLLDDSGMIANWDNFIAANNIRIDSRQKRRSRKIIKAFSPVAVSPNLSGYLSVEGASVLSRVIHHANRTWAVCNSIISILDVQNNNNHKGITISNLIWGEEYIKYGIIKAYEKLNRQNVRNIDFQPILGMTVFGSKGIRLPTHDPEQAVCIFDDYVEIANKVHLTGLNNFAAIKTYIDLLGRICIPIICEKYTGNNYKALAINQLGIEQNNTANYNEEVYQVVGMIITIRREISKMLDSQNEN